MGARTRDLKNRGGLARWLTPRCRVFTVFLLIPLEASVVKQCTDLFFLLLSL